MVASDLDLGDPINKGIVSVDSGRAPSAANEVFLSRFAANYFKVATGDTLKLTTRNNEGGPRPIEWHISGIGRFVDDYAAQTVIVPSIADYPDTSGSSIPQTLRVRADAAAVADVERVVGKSGLTGTKLPLRPSNKPGFFAIQSKRSSSVHCVPAVASRIPGAANSPRHCGIRSAVYVACRRYGPGPGRR